MQKLPPFKVGGIVEPPFFVGREKELNTLVNSAVNLTQNALLLAPRRYGKSSLLHNVRVQTEARSDTLVTEMNC